MDTENSLRKAVIRDFDRLAACEQPVWNHNIHYYPLILRQLPPRMERVLDIGCGSGDLVRRLTGYASRVEGIDFSSGMIARAQALTPPAQYPHVRYQCADVMETPLEEEGYDAIVSVATVHHLPLADCLAKIHSALKPGGTLVLLDLYQPATAGDMFASLAAVPVSRILRLLKCRGLTESKHEAALWAEHGQHDQYQSIHEVATTARSIFPTVNVRRLLLWRYLLVARKGA